MPSHDPSRFCQLQRILTSHELLIVNMPMHVEQPKIFTFQDWKKNYENFTLRAGPQI